MTNKDKKSQQIEEVHLDTMVHHPQD
jgi:hypothetical protein